MSHATRPQARRTLAKQGPPPGIYASKYDTLLGAAICRRIAAGEAIRSICADPAMPTGKTIWNWARAHPEFAAMKRHALETARARSLAAREARARAAAQRREAAGPRRVAWNAGLDGYRYDIDGVVLRIRLGLADGQTVAQVCDDPDMPSVGTVYNWLKRYPEFLAQYRTAKTMGMETVVNDSCLDLPWLGERASWVLLGRTLKAAERRARRLALKRYAQPQGPAGIVLEVRGPGQADGEGVVIYQGVRPE